MAAENNPALRADFLGYQAALRQLPQAGAYPDPTLDMGFFLDPMAIVGGKQVAQFKLMQMFPWFGTKGAAHAEATHEARMAYEKFRASRDALYLAVYTQWYKLCALRQRWLTRRESRQLLARLEELATSRFTAGKGGMSAVLRVRMELAEADDAIAESRSALEVAEAKFNVLLNRPAATAVQVPDSLEATSYVFDEASTRAGIERLNPALGLLDEERLADEAKTKLARKRGYPMLGVGLQYMLNKKTNDPMLGMGGMNGRDMVMPMVSVSIPIYRAKYKAARRQGLLWREASRAKYAGTLSALEARLVEARHELDDAARRMALYKEQIRLARSAYELALREFEAGTSGLTNVIEVERQLLDYRLKSAEAVADYNTKVATIRSLASFGQEREE
jgi:outer membrane protein TolC